VTGPTPDETKGEIICTVYRKTVTKPLPAVGCRLEVGGTMGDPRPWLVVAVLGRDPRSIASSWEAQGEANCTSLPVLC